MTEEIAVDMQPTTPVEQVAGTSGSATPGQQGANSVDWEARYKGLVKKVEELTLANRTLTEQLATKSSETEQLRGQLTVKDTEKATTLSQRDQMLQQVTQEKTALQAQINELQGLALKVKVIRELNRPELLSIADKLPSMTDEAALKTVLQDFAGFADGLVQKRERELLAGTTPALSSAGNSKAGVPASEAEWESHINSLGLGTPERTRAMDDYWKWLENKHKGS